MQLKDQIPNRKVGSGLSYRLGHTGAQSMIEAIAGLFMAALAGLAYVFKVQRDSARKDAEEKRKEADQAKSIAETKQNQNEELIRSAEKKEKIDEKTDEIVKRPERDFFE